MTYALLKKFIISSFNRKCEERRNKMTFYKYNHYVKSDIKEWFIWNLNEYLTDNEVEQIEPRLALKYFLEWNGILGYDKEILEILDPKVEQDE